MKLIPEWQSAWQMYSVQIAAVIAVLGALQASWPLFQQFVSPLVFAVITSLLGIGVVVGRVIEQQVLHQDDDA